jgi:hypothetical protein
LDILYKEYNSLKAKLDNVKSTIIAYGGIVPDKSVEHVHVKSDFEQLTWKEKVKYILKELNKPASVVEITDFIINRYSNMDRNKIHRTITQFTSSMNLKGEIEVEKNTGISKYFLKSQ